MISAPARLQDRVWRSKNSLWIIGTLAFGFLTWASFLYIGLLAKSRVWLRVAATYAVLGIAGWMLIGNAPLDEDGVGTGWIMYTGVTLVMIAWIGGFLHAIIVNKQWLRGRSLAAARHKSDPTEYGSDKPYSQDVGDGSDADDPGKFFAPGHAYVPSPTHKPPMPPSARAPLPAGVPVDVNTVGLSALLDAGLDAPAGERVIAERTGRGAFKTVEEFVEVAQLPPQVVAALLPRLTITFQDS